MGRVNGDWGDRGEVVGQRTRAREENCEPCDGTWRVEGDLSESELVSGVVIVVSSESCTGVTRYLKTHSPGAADIDSIVVHADESARSIPLVRRADEQEKERGRARTTAGRNRPIATCARRSRCHHSRPLRWFSQKSSSALYSTTSLRASLRYRRTSSSGGTRSCRRAQRAASYRGSSSHTDAGCCTRTSTRESVVLLRPGPPSARSQKLSPMLSTTTPTLPPSPRAARSSCTHRLDRLTPPHSVRSVGPFVRSVPARRHR